jgi:hypothetical protein
MKNVVTWDVTSCDFCKTRSYGGKYHFYHQSDKNRRPRNFPRSVIRLLVIANVNNSQILVTLMIDAISSSETSVLSKPHAVTFQKTAFIIVTAVKTLNLTSH